jgi:hypothetical protein
MTGPVIIDSNLLLLLIVGSTDRSYIKIHKNLSAYTDDDFDLLVIILTQFSDILTLPHIVTEVSNLARQIRNPARSKIQIKLREFIEITTELPIPSLLGARRAEFYKLGLTDAVALQGCAVPLGGLEVTLLTADTNLANQATALGYSALLYSELLI